MPTAKSPTIAITSIGSLVGSAILDSLEHRRTEFRIIGYNSLPEAINNFRAAVAYLVPPASDLDGYRATLTRRIAEDRPDLVLAGRDEDIGILSTISGGSTFEGTTIVARCRGYPAR